MRWPAAQRSRLWWSVGCGVAALVVACVWLPVPWSLAMVLVGIVAGESVRFFVCGGLVYK